jgi:alkaline phosphatase D
MPPQQPDRRRLLIAGLKAATLGLTAVIVPASAGTRGRASRIAEFPFTLGVASGFPGSTGFVLWTRLAPEPAAPRGGLAPGDFPVQWEVAADERFRDLRRRGTEWATPEWGHSIHVEVDGLEPGRPYWYRFRAGQWQSPVGRTWTAPLAGAPLAQLRLALACCQNFEAGYYHAYRRMLADHPDLIVHVGDYIYEGAAGSGNPRSHGAGECFTLEDYRRRYALYKGDPDLQAAHAACPWLYTWDDHEVANDYANDSSERDDPPSLFLARRAAAYRACYEHLPLPRQMAPFGPDARLYTSLSFGDLATVLLLDERQYRSQQACPLPGRHGSNTVGDDCAQLHEPGRTMLGARQEAWLDARLARDTSRWQLLAQGVLMAHVDEVAPPEHRYWTDSWNGYPDPRQRLLARLGAQTSLNPLVLSGDIHGFVASDLNKVAAEPDSPAVASEIVTTSISSLPAGEELFERAMRLNPNVRYATGRFRGHVNLLIGRDQLRAELVGLDVAPTQAQSGAVPAAQVRKSFVVDTGRRGLQPA